MTSPRIPPQPASIAGRRRAGIDRRDEVWAGAYRMVPDTRIPELFEPDGESLEPALPTKDGWLRGRATGLELRAGAPGKLHLWLGGDPPGARELPED
jgi:hypothetical protein